METFSQLHMVLAAAAFAVSGFFSTLAESFALTAQAGILRLTEKYPSSRERITRWAPRWDLLYSSLLICAATTQVAAVYLVALTVRAPTSDTLTDVAAILVAALLCMVTFVLAPHMLSESYADKLSVSFLPLAAVLSRALLPVALPLAHFERKALSRLMSGTDEEDHPTTEDEIRSLVEQASPDAIEEEERTIIRSAFELGDTVAREIMTPRVAIESLEDTLTITECVEQVKTSSHSRFPVFHERRDDILGIVHVKDLLRLMSDGHGEKLVSEVVNRATFVPETMPINDLLTQLRTERSQLAIIVDEYGGTAGLASMEDIIEELVGEIHDEYDTAEQKFQQLADGSAIINASLPVDEVNEKFGIQIPEREDYDSVGGFVFHELGHIPHPGETVDGVGFQITIQSADARRLHTMRIVKT